MGSLISGLLLGAPRAVAAATVSITVTPTQLLSGDKVAASGKASTSQVRPVQLQRATVGDQGFTTVAAGSTKPGGGYSLADTVSRTGTYRAFLPATKVAGASLPALTSAALVVSPASRLENGRTLASGQSLLAPDGSYTLTMRTDGNLVLAAAATPTIAEWSTKTKTKGSRLVLQYRGNLVLVGPDQKLLWDTGTADTTAYLALGNGGRLGVYSGDGTKLWGRKGGLVSGASPTGVRAQSWVDAKVKYSQSKYYTNKYGTYRTDCSGFISMAWGLKSSYNTRTIPDITTKITKAELKPGDVLNAYNYHLVLFDGWANAEKTKYWAYENTPSTNAAHHVIPYPYWSSSRGQTFVPRQLNAASARLGARGFAPGSGFRPATGGGDAGPVGPSASYAR